MCVLGYPSIDDHEYNIRLHMHYIFMYGNTNGYMNKEEKKRFNQWGTLSEVQTSFGSDCRYREIRWGPP